MSEERKCLTLGVDLGGTKIKAALVDEKGEILFSNRRPTLADEGFEVVIGEVTAAVGECLEETDTVANALGIGVAGQVDAESGAVRFAPNLEWRDVPLRKVLEEKLEIPVRVINDVRAITLGEWLHGAGRGVDELVCLFVGTGIGGGIVSGGRLTHGCSNTAGEIGHITVVAGGRKCTCRNHGCLEAYAGGWGIAERAREAVRRNPKEGRGLSSRVSSLEDLAASTVADAWHDGDPLARRLVDETATFLSAGIVTVVNALNPCRIILGGGVLEGLPELLSMVKEKVRALALEAALLEMEIVPSKLGASAGVIGAAALARTDTKGKDRKKAL